MSKKIISKISKKGSIFQLLFETIVIEIGLMISCFGTALFYAAALGSSPMATFSDGIHNLFSISYGAANTVMNIVFLVVLLFLEKKYINIGTVLCVFTIGPWVNVFNTLLQGIAIAEMHMAIRILSTIMGTVLMGVGLGLYVAVDRGFGALEGLVKVLCARAGMSTSKAKILQDVILVTGGILLRATWGIGTLIAIVFTGPLLNQSIKFFSNKVFKSVQN